MFFYTIIDEWKLEEYADAALWGKADEVLSVLETYFHARIIPDQTLIIFDEIQMCERALTSLKYFAEEASEYHVIAAGSILRRIRSWRRNCTRMPCRNTGITVSPEECLP